jgi:hypothetical protein
MAPRLSRASLALVLLAGVSSGASAADTKPSPVLARYSFDDRLVDTGPDTFAVFRNARGNVQLSTDFQVSGHRSVELRDVAGDGDFPELQGYLPERRDGWLVIHFALLVADPQEELNVSFAGPGWFNLGPNGHALWLTTRDGWLHHTTGKAAKPLLALEPYTWYAVDVDYDATRGRYDLRVTAEGSAEPAVSLKDQPNASDHPGSIVSLFSFVGSVYGDRSNVRFWLDDLWIGTSREAVLPPFIAPGRRKLFADRLDPKFQALRDAGRHAEARDYALERVRQLKAEGAPPAAWLERAGDAAFAASDHAGAQRLYEQALSTAPDTAENRTPLLLKLSDVHHLLGHPDKEKAYREQVYGSLDPRD